MPPSGAAKSKSASIWMECRPASARQAAEQFSASQMPDSQQIALVHRCGSRATSSSPSGLKAGHDVREIAPVRSRQANQLAVVVQPAHDHLAGSLHERIPLQGGIDHASRRRRRSRAAGARGGRPVPARRWHGCGSRAVVCGPRDRLPGPARPGEAGRGCRTVGPRARCAGGRLLRPGAIFPAPAALAARPSGSGSARPRSAWSCSR